MLALQKCKIQRGILPQADLTGSTTAVSYTFDTNGCKAVHLIIMCGTLGTAMDALKVQEADAASSTALTNGTDIALADFSVSPLTLAGAAGTGLVSMVTIPVTGARKRYLRLLTDFPAAASFLCAVWIGEQVDEAPNTAAKRGLAQHAIVAG